MLIKELERKIVETKNVKADLEYLKHILLTKKEIAANTEYKLTDVTTYCRELEQKEKRFVTNEAKKYDVFTLEPEEIRAVHSQILSKLELVNKYIGIKWKYIIKVTENIGINVNICVDNYSVTKNLYKVVNIKSLEYLTTSYSLVNYLLLCEAISLILLDQIENVLKLNNWKSIIYIMKKYLSDNLCKLMLDKIKSVSHKKYVILLSEVI